jgi:peptidoglycan/LPS O-acetylase OafA/YrhL
MKNDKLASIQVLRGLAALAVMLFHFRWNINLSYPKLGESVIRMGGNWC